MWDIGGDNHETFDGAGVLELADLSLDDPEFEVMLFQGDERGFLTWSWTKTYLSLEVSFSLTM